jgi:hypothetical protein
VSAETEYRLDADLDTTGRFDVTGFGAGLDARGALTDQTTLDASVSLARHTYDFSGLPDNRDLWDDVHAVSLRAFLRHDLARRRTLFGGPIVSAEFEEDLDGDSVTLGGIVGLTQFNSPKLVWGIGVAVMGQIEDDPMVFPAPFLRWAFADAWMLNVGAAGAGPGVKVERRWSASWGSAIRVAYQSTRFRLDDEGRAPGGVGEDSAFPVYVETYWLPRAGCRLEAVAGACLDGELTIEDRNGHKTASDDYDTQAVIGIRATHTF